MVYVWVYVGRMSLSPGLCQAYVPISGSMLGVCPYVWVYVSRNQWRTNGEPMVNQRGTIGGTIKRRLTETKFYSIKIYSKKTNGQQKKTEKVRIF